MKNLEEIETSKWLEDNGISHMDIIYIKSIYYKEGITFCRKTFHSLNITDMKKELYEINNKKEEKLWKSILSNVKGINVNEVYNRIIH